MKYHPHNIIGIDQYDNSKDEVEFLRHFPLS